MSYTPNVDVPTSILSVSSSGGPVLVSGAPSQLTIDQVKSLQGSGEGSGNLSPHTAAGDTSLSFSSAPMSIMPGQWIQLQGSGTEYVRVAASYVPSASATTIPLTNPVVGANHTVATWDAWADLGPQGAPILPTNIAVVAPVMQDANGNGGTYMFNNAAGDGSNPSKFVEVVTAIFNGSTVDRIRGNQDNISLLASGARTTTQTLADQTNYNARGMYLVVDVTAGSTPSLTPAIQMKDPVSGKYIQLHASFTAIAATGTFTYHIYPGIGASAGGVTAIASFALPRTWRVVITVGNSNSITYSVGAALIV